MWKKALLSILPLLAWQSLCAQSVRWATAPTYTQVRPFDGGAYKFFQEGKVGLIDLSGKVILDAAYDSITDVIDDYAIALSADGSRYVVGGILHRQAGHYTYHRVSELYYLPRNYGYLSEDKLVVRNKDGAYGYIDHTGRTVIPFAFGEARPFFDGLASVKKMGNKQNVYYISADGHILPMEPGDGAILFGTSFSDGNAVVYTFGRKGYVIDTKGRIVSNYKDDVNVTVQGLNRRDFTVSGKEHTSFFKMTPSEVASDPVRAFRGNVYFGYKKGELSVVPAQFDEADDFKGGYAKVKMNSKYGFLSLVDGTYDASLSKEKAEVSANRCEPLQYVVNTPRGLDLSKQSIHIFGSYGECANVSMQKAGDRQLLFTFVPEVRNREKSQDFSFKLYADDILVWDDVKTVTFSYPVLMKLGEPIAPNSRAGEDDKFPLQVYVENNSGVAQSITVTFHVSEFGNFSTNVNLSAGGSERATVLVPNVHEEKMHKVYVTLSNGLTGQSVNLLFRPFY